MNGDAPAALDEAGQIVMPGNAAMDTGEQGPSGEEQRQPRERRSRDRYGRDRRERNDGDRAQQPAVNGDVNAPAAQSEQDQQPRDTFQPASMEAAQPVAQPVWTPAPEPVAAAVTPRPVVVMPSVPSAPAAPVMASVAPASTALPVVQSYALPLQALAQVAETSGLVWVNSDPARIAEAQAVMAAEVKPTHVPRERPPLAVSDEGPLVLVETRRDLASMKLPFETPETPAA